MEVRIIICHWFRISQIRYCNANAHGTVIAVSRGNYGDANSRPSNLNFVLYSIFLSPFEFSVRNSFDKLIFLIGTYCIGLCANFYVVWLPRILFMPAPIPSEKQLGSEFPLIWISSLKLSLPIKFHFELNSNISLVPSSLAKPNWRLWLLWRCDVSPLYTGFQVLHPS